MQLERYIDAVLRHRWLVVALHASEIAGRLVSISWAISWSVHDAFPKWPGESPQGSSLFIGKGLTKPPPGLYLPSRGVLQWGMAPAIKRVIANHREAGDPGRRGMSFQGDNIHDPALG